MKRRLLQAGIGITLVLGAGTAEVVPQDMKPIMQYTYAPSDIGATTTPGYNFVDENGNNSIAVAMYEDAKGERVYEQIPDTQYDEMKQVDGYKKNPKKSELVSLLAALTPKANAAIAFETQSKGVRVSATSITWTCNFTGSNVMALISVGDNDTADVNATTLTVNGSAATFIDRNQLPSGGQGNLSLFYKLAPTNGNCVGSSLTGTDVLDGHMVSYSDVHQTVSFNKDPNSLFAAFQNATTTTNGTTFTQTTTPCASGSWLVWVMQNDTGAADTTGTAGTNFATRNSTAAGAIAIGDTNGTVTAGVGTTQSTSTSSGASNWEGIQVSIAPTGATCGAGAAPFLNNDQWFLLL